MEDSNDPRKLSEFYLKYGLATRCIHAGERVGQPKHSAHTGGIFQTSTFVFENAEEGAALFSGNQDGYIYTRLGNPTVKLLEAKINALEGGNLKKKNPDITVSTQAFASGMAAISSTIMALVKGGDTLIQGNVIYGCTEHLSSYVLPQFNIKTVEVDTTNLDDVERVLRLNPKAKAFLLETPTNPLLAVSDIAGIKKLIDALAPNCKLIVDNTFCSPYLQRPLELGADVVVHSTTKYICGHGTVVGGLVTTIHEDIKNELFIMLKDFGSNPGPFDAWLVNLGLKTLPIRMDKHSENAMKIANYLESHDKVAVVHYPGLKSNKYHELAKKQMSNFGGILSFELKGGINSGRKMMNNIDLFTLAVSLGCVDSLIQHPASMTHACVEEEKRKKIGITDGLVRVSVGIENVEDLLSALEDVLKIC